MIYQDILGQINLKFFDYEIENQEERGLLLAQQKEMVEELEQKQKPSFFKEVEKI